MKKVFFVLVTVFTAMTASAQTGQGRLFVNGQFSFSTQSNSDNYDKYSRFSIVPAAGYFVADRLALGLGIGVVGTSSEDEDYPDNGYKRTNSTFLLAPFVRYYVPTSNEDFQFFAQARLGVGFAKSTARTENVKVETDNGTSLDFSVSPGFSYFPTDHWGIELVIRGLYVESYNPKGNGATRTTVGLDASSLAPALGISYFF